MSLRGSEQRALTGIEQDLQAGDARLQSLFNCFDRLTQHEAMPVREQLRNRRWQAHPHLMLMIALAMIISGITALVITVPARPCGAARGGVIGALPIPPPDNTSRAAGASSASSSHPAC